MQRQADPNSDHVQSPRRAPAAFHSQAGVTLIEVLIVLGIIALLATVVTPQVLGYLGRARVG